MAEKRPNKSGWMIDMGHPDIIRFVTGCPE
jgi:hypothetical protein